MYEGKYDIYTSLKIMAVDVSLVLNVPLNFHTTGLKKPIIESDVASLLAWKTSICKACSRLTCVSGWFVSVYIEEPAVDAG